MKRKKTKKKLTFQSEDLNPRFSVTFLPMIWIFMESEEPEIKSKQASKRDRTLKSRLTIQFFPPQNTRNRLRKRRAQTSNLQVLSQSNSNINKSTKIVTKIVSPKNGHNNGSPNSRTTQIPEVSTLVTKQEIAQEKSSGLHQEAITPVVNQL